MKRLLIPLALAVVVIGLFCTQITLFIVQPIGAVPDGVTAVIWRLEDSQFIDSADAMCERSRGGVSLLCRASMMASAAREDTIIARLPYSSWLYSISTGGVEYSR